MIVSEFEIDSQGEAFVVAAFAVSTFSLILFFLNCCDWLCG